MYFLYWFFTPFITFQQPQESCSLCQIEVNTLPIEDPRQSLSVRDLSNHYGLLTSVSRNSYLAPPSSRGLPSPVPAYSQEQIRPVSYSPSPAYEGNKNQIRYLNSASPGCYNSGISWINASPGYTNSGMTGVNASPGYSNFSVPTNESHLGHNETVIPPEYSSSGATGAAASQGYSSSITTAAAAFPGCSNTVTTGEVCSDSAVSPECSTWDKNGKGYSNSGFSQTESDLPEHHNNTHQKIYATYV